MTLTPRSTRYLLATLCAPALVVALVPSATASGAPRAPKVPSAASPALESFVIAPDDIAPGLVRRLPAIGKGLRYTTLDGLCGLGFYSELLRKGRRQVWFTRKGSRTRDSLASQEVVRYRHGSAHEVRAEITDAAKRCAAPQLLTNSKGNTELDRIKRFRASGLPKGSIAMVDVVRRPATGTVKHVYRSVYVYQLHDDVLSAVYVYPPKRMSTAKAKHIAVRAAQAAHRLLVA